MPTGRRNVGEVEIQEWDARASDFDHRKDKGCGIESDEKKREKGQSDEKLARKNRRKPWTKKTKKRSIGRDYRPMPGKKKKMIFPGARGTQYVGNTKDQNTKCKDGAQNRQAATL